MHRAQQGAVEILSMDTAHSLDFVHVRHRRPFSGRIYVCKDGCELQTQWYLELVELYWRIWLLIGRF